MTDTNLFRLSQPGTFTDPLSEVLRNGARALLAQAVEAEVSSMLSYHADELTDDGRRRLVRHGHLPERTGIGPVAVRCPRVRLAEAAEKSWRRLNGHNQLPKIILGIKFTDGIEVVRSQAQTAAA